MFQNYSRILVLIVTEFKYESYFIRFTNSNTSPSIEVSGDHIAVTDDNVILKYSFNERKKRDGDNDLIGRSELRNGKQR